MFDSLRLEAVTTRAIPRCLLAIAVQVVYYAFVLLTHRLLFTTTVDRSFPVNYPPAPEDLSLLNADEHGALLDLRTYLESCCTARKENCSLFQILSFLATFKLLPGSSAA